MTSFVPYGTLTFCKNCGEQNPYHRELTDEEITEIGLAHGAFFTESKHHLWGDDLEIHEFARAILKKASEK